MTFLNNDLEVQEQLLRFLYWLCRNKETYIIRFNRSVAARSDSIARAESPGPFSDRQPELQPHNFLTNPYLARIRGRHDTSTWSATVYIYLSKTFRLSPPYKSNRRTLVGLFATHCRQSAAVFFDSGTWLISLGNTPPRDPSTLIKRPALPMLQDYRLIYRLMCFLCISAQMRGMWCIGHNKKVSGWKKHLQFW